MATLHVNREQYDKAQPLSTRSIALLEKTVPPEHPDLIRSLDDYEALLRATNRPDEAKAVRERIQMGRAAQ